MNKRDAVFGMLEGDRQSIPAGFFTHFDPSCHQGQAAVDKHLEFFRFTGMDFVKVQYERTFPHIDSIQKPQDWANIPCFGLEFYDPQLRVVEGLVRAAKAEAPVIITLYSPFMCAGHLAGQATLNKHLAEDPDDVKRGMQIVTDSLMIFVQECIRLGVDGFYHSTQGAESGRFRDPGIFDHCIKPYDLILMNEIDRSCEFNILHICDYHRDEFGGYDALSPFLDYPGHVVNCSPDVGGRRMSGAEISAMFQRPFMGGMERKGELATGTEEQARGAAREALRDAPERFILGADCTVPAGTPWQNLRAAIEEAHKGRA